MIDATVTRNQSLAGTGTDPETARAAGGPGDAVLEVGDLHKSYRAGFWGRRAAPAVAGVDLSVRRGEIFALLGHNGAGKTTTMKAVLGLVRPDRGRIILAGRDARDPRARASVGYLPESPHFYENLTATELLETYGRLLGMDREDRRYRIAECLDLVGMAPFAGRRLGACSKGMRQRVGLAQALLGRPEILILDEPQSGLDPAGRRQVREILLAQRAAGVTVVFSSHVVPDVEAVADRVAMLNHGRVTGVVDMARREVARGFAVQLAGLPTAGALAHLVESAAYTVGEATAGRITITAAGAPALARLLDTCAADGIGVLDVQTAGSGLEDMFLQATAAGEEV